MSSYDKLTNEFNFTPEPSFLQRLNWLDWLWALAITVGAGVWLYRQAMDGFELAILAGTTPALIGLGWFWKSIRFYAFTVIALSLLSLALYSGQRELAETSFFLKYLLSSQSAIMWMSTLFVMATLTYFLGLFTRSEITLKTASYLT